MGEGVLLSSDAEMTIINLDRARCTSKYDLKGGWLFPWLVAFAGIDIWGPEYSHHKHKGHFKSEQ